MESVETLIDAASKRIGSRRKLADAIGEDASFLTRINMGVKPMPPGVAALCAEHAETDPREAALEAVVNAEADLTKRAHLARLLHVKNWRKR